MFKGCEYSLYNVKEIRVLKLIFTDFHFDGKTWFYGIKSLLPIGGGWAEGFHLEEKVMSDEVVLNIPLRRKERTEILFELEQVDNKRRECNMSHLQRR